MYADASLFADPMSPELAPAMRLRTRLSLVLRLITPISVGALAFLLALRQLLLPPYHKRLNRFMNAAWFATVWVVVGSFFALHRILLGPLHSDATILRGLLVEATLCGVMAFFLGFGDRLANGLGKLLWHPPVMIKTILIIVACGAAMFYSNRFWDRVAASFVQRVMPTNRNETYFLYATDGHRGWVLWSQGPDAKPDLPAEKIPGWLAEFSREEVISRLQPYSYDPTNGTTSPGDIWRIHE
jgi:hypothetical protein